MVFVDGVLLLFPQLPQYPIHLDSFQFNNLLYLLNCYDCCSPNLNFIGTSMFNNCFICDKFCELLRILHYTQMVEYLRDSVIWEHRQFTYIIKLSKTLSLKSCIDISN